MKCPNDNATLIMSERSGVEIDYCPECRGVWLDRGELDKIIQNTRPSQSNRSETEQNHEHHDNSNRTSFNSHSDRYEQKPKKKESFMGDLFDF